MLAKAHPVRYGTRGTDTARRGAQGKSAKDTHGLLSRSRITARDACQQKDVPHA